MYQTKVCTDKHVIQRFYPLHLTLSITAPRLCQLSLIICQLQSVGWDCQVYSADHRHQERMVNRQRNTCPLFRGRCHRPRLITWTSKFAFQVSNEAKTKKNLSPVSKGVSNMLAATRIINLHMSQRLLIKQLAPYCTLMARIPGVSSLNLL